MKNTRAKLVCSKVAPAYDGSTAPQKNAENVSFETRYNQQDSPEDNTFSSFTPYGNCTLSITNPELFGAFEEGKAYYFDITPCA